MASASRAGGYGFGSGLIHQPGKIINFMPIIHKKKYVVSAQMIESLGRDF